MQPAPVASAPISVPLVNGSPVQAPVPVPVSGGVPLPGIANTTLARPEVGCVLELFSVPSTCEKSCGLQFLIQIQPQRVRNFMFCCRTDLMPNMASVHLYSSCVMSLTFGPPPHFSPTQIVMRWFRFRHS